MRIELSKAATHTDQRRRRSYASGPRGSIGPYMPGKQLQTRPRRPRALADPGKTALSYLEATPGKVKFYLPCTSEKHIHHSPSHLSSSRSLQHPQHPPQRTHTHCTTHCSARHSAPAPTTAHLHPLQRPPQRTCTHHSAPAPTAEPPHAPISGPEVSIEPTPRKTALTLFGPGTPRLLTTFLLLPTLHFLLDPRL